MPEDTEACLLLMRAVTVLALRPITIHAQNLEACRKLGPNKPSNYVTTSKLLPMLGTAAVNMVNGKELYLVFSATFAPSAAIGFHDQDASASDVLDESAGVLNSARLATLSATNRRQLATRNACPRRLATGIDSGRAAKTRLAALAAFYVSLGTTRAQASGSSVAFRCGDATGSKLTNRHETIGAVYPQPFERTVALGAIAGLFSLVMCRGHVICSRVFEGCL